MLLLLTSLCTPHHQNVVLKDAAGLRAMGSYLMQPEEVKNFPLGLRSAVNFSNLTQKGVSEV